MSTRLLAASCRSTMIYIYIYIHIYIVAYQFLIAFFLHTIVSHDVFLPWLCIQISVCNPHTSRQKAAVQKPSICERRRNPETYCHVRTFWMIHTSENTVNTMVCTKNGIAKSTHRHVPTSSRMFLSAYQGEAVAHWRLRGANRAWRPGQHNPWVSCGGFHKWKVPQKRDDL